MNRINNQMTYTAIRHLFNPLPPSNHVVQILQVSIIMNIPNTSNKKRYSVKILNLLTNEFKILLQIGDNFTIILKIHLKFTTYNIKINPFLNWR